MARASDSAKQQPTAILTRGRVFDEAKYLEPYCLVKERRVENE